MQPADSTSREKYAGQVGSFTCTGSIEVPVCAACLEHRRKWRLVGLLIALLLVVTFFVVLSFTIGRLDEHPGQFLASIGGYLVLNLGSAVAMARTRRTWPRRHRGHVHPTGWVRVTPGTSPANPDGLMLWLGFRNPGYAAAFAEAHPEARDAGVALEDLLAAAHRSR
jgi:hypothetical protein